MNKEMVGTTLTSMTCWYEMTPQDTFRCLMRKLFVRLGELRILTMV